ncbi:MAG: DHHW family protein [Candidatus Aminicenantes bacterium]|nr:DHHW family protein [Candidatus Aminicenantes bacterium]
MMKTLPKSTCLSRRNLNLWFNFKKNSGLPLLFLILISLPLLDGFFKISQAAPSNEKRKLADKPHFSILDPFGYLKYFESYFNDNFGFRDQLVYFHNMIQVMVLRTSPLDRVVIGRDGWLFLGRETEFRDEINYFRSVKLFSKAELMRWRTVLQRRRQWFQHRGIFYIFIVIPNKSTIYPEYLPRTIRKANQQSRLDQLLAALRRDPDFPVLDFREIFSREKNNSLLFYRTDTHWTELGAYFAYREIMKKLAAAFPGVRAASLDQFTVESGGYFNGDLALELCLQNSKFKEQDIVLRAKTPAPFATSSAESEPGRFIRKTISECPSGVLPTALIVHDSFMFQLKPFFQPHFQRIVYIWDWNWRFLLEEIESEKPKIVIDEMVERFLSDRMPANPPGMTDSDKD